MYYILSVFGSILIALTLPVNGQLAVETGTYLSTVIIHMVGLVLITLILLMRKEKIFKKQGVKIPVTSYAGGIIGVVTVVFNNMAFGKISVSAIIALSLFGQILTSLAVDQFGLFHMPMKKFNKGKLIGLVCVLGGILYMLSGERKIGLAVLLAFLTGVSIVVSRSINAQLAQSKGPFVSSWFNYATGTVTAILVMLLMQSGHIGLANLSPQLWSKAWLFTGGILGVGLVTISNICNDKLPAFQMTVILFAGQIFTGIILDLLMGAKFSQETFVGACFALIGLVLNVWLDQKTASEAVPISN